MNQKVISGAIIVILASTVGYFAFVKKSEPIAQQTPPITTQSNTLAPTPTPKDQTANWKTYTNTQYGFSFKYPPEFKITSDSVATYGSVANNAHLIELTKLDDKGFLDKWIAIEAWVGSSNSSNGGTKQVIGDVTWTIDFNEDYPPGSEQPEGHLVLTTIQNNINYEISLEPNNTKDADPAYLAILSTLEFTK